MKTRTSFIGLLLFLAYSIPARADSVLVGTTTLGNSFILTVNSFQFLGQDFSFNEAASISEINLFMNGAGSGQFTVQLTDAIGPSTTLSDVLFQAAAPFPTSGGLWVSVPASLSLGPGNYFLVLSSNQSAYQGWLGGGSALPSSVGSVGFGSVSNSFCCTFNDSFPPASSWTPLFLQGPNGFANFPFTFEIVGSAPAPEPNSLRLLSCALAVLWGLRRLRTT